LPTSLLIVAWPTFALYAHKGLTDHKLITGHFPWLDGLYLVDIITVVMACVLAKSLEVQFPLRANKADQTYSHIVTSLGYLSAYPFCLHLGGQHFVHVGLYVFPHTAYMAPGPDHCWGALDSGVVSFVVVLNYLWHDIKISAQVTCCHVLHNHALYCSIKLLNLPIATWLIGEAGNMLDMEVVKQLLHVGIGELAAVVALEYLGGMLLEERPEYL